MDLQLKKNILWEFYKYLKDRGYQNIKSSLLELESPNEVVEKQTENAFEPDLTATYKSKPYIFEIETPESIKLSKEKFVKKCNTFLRYTNSKNGKLYLIVPVQYFDKIFLELNKYNLENVGILQIDSAKALCQ
jgi:Holliday junction resolvase